MDPDLQLINVSVLRVLFHVNKYEICHVNTLNIDSIMHFYLLTFIEMYKKFSICKKHLYIMHCYKYCNFVHFSEELIALQII